MTDEEKDAVSHRGEAYRKLGELTSPREMRTFRPRDGTERETGQPLFRFRHRSPQTPPVSAYVSMSVDAERGRGRALAGPLKYGRVQRKDKRMWVYDGEEWTEDDGSEQSTTVQAETPRPAL